MSGRRGEQALAAALVCLVTVVAFETMSVATILPKVRDDVGGLGLYGWAFSGLALGQVLGIVVTGPWIDRANLRTPLLVGLGVYCAGLVVSGLAGSMLVVVVGRVLQGYGSGTVPAVAYVCVGRGFGETERAKVFAWMATAWIVPAMVGPSAAAAVAERVSWRWVFLALIPVVVVVGAAAIPAVARLDRAAAAGRDAGLPSASESGAGRVAGLAVACVLGAGLALSSLDSTALAAQITGFAVGGTVLAVAFRGIAPPGTLRLAPGVPATVVVRGLLTFSFLGADAYVALALADVKGMSTQAAGVVVSSAAITWTAGAWFAARTIGRIGPRRLVATGMAVVGVGIGALLAVVSTDVSGWLAAPAWMVGGLGIGMAYSPLSQAVLGAAEPSQLGSATSALQLSDVLGFALGSGLGGAAVAIADRRDLELGGSTVHAGVLVAWVLTGVVALAGVAAARRITAMLPTSAAAPDRAAPDQPGAAASTAGVAPGDQGSDA